MVKRTRDDDGASSSAESNEEQSAKYIQIRNTPGSAKTTQVLTCDLPSHGSLSFSTHEEYEIHYYKDHVNRCSECSRNFPTDHFLQLHITENHDPISAARKARGEKIFQCFVEDCTRICSAPVKRRRHLVDKHLFPQNYDFFIVNDGIDKRNSMLHISGRSRGDSSTTEDVGKHKNTEHFPSSQLGKSHEHDGDPPLTHGENADPPSSSTSADGIQDLTLSMNALRFVPPSVRFGRGGRKTFPRS